MCSGLRCRCGFIFYGAGGLTLMRLLSVAHNHSSIHPGGTEMMAEGLHAGYQRMPGVEARLLAAVDPGLREGVPGTTITSAKHDPSLFYFRAPGFDSVNQSRYSLEPLLYDVTWFLRDFKPNVVHIHHLNHYGVEFLQLLRKEVPAAKIYLTLHDYYLMCGRDGLLFTADGKRCAGPDPEACFRCHPDRSPAAFAARDVLVKKHLRLADRLIAPSAFLRDRFIDWGLSPAQIDILPNGWRVDTGGKAEIMPALNQFTLLGNLRATKGTLVALRAFLAAARDMDEKPVLDIYGAALYQPALFEDEVNALIDQSDGMICAHDGYTSADLPAILAKTAWMLVPSIWWENAPLVVNEAFSFKRPVICSDIGGMAEAVDNGVNGLHVPAGNVAAWCAAIKNTSGNEVLWRKLYRGIAPVRSIDAAAADYLALFKNAKAA